LLAEDLVDELFIGVSPVLLGEGIPAFPPRFPQRDFQLMECKSYANGSVGFRYARPQEVSRRARSEIRTQQSSRRARSEGEARAQ